MAESLTTDEKVNRHMRLTAREYRAWKRWEGRGKRAARWLEKRDRALVTGWWHEPVWRGKGQAK